MSVHWELGEIWGGGLRGQTCLFTGNCERYGEEG